MKPLTTIIKQLFNLNFMPIKSIRFIVPIVILLLTIISCKTKTSDSRNVTDDGRAYQKVILTKEQIRQADIKLAKIEKRPIANVVKCKGMIESSPNGVAFVCAPLGGFIKKTFYLPGTYVKKGDILARLEHPDYIKLQQEYLETKNQLDYYKEEFKRQGELTVENASSIKKMQQAQADFRTLEVKLLSLKTQLSLLGINSDSLSLEKFRTVIDLKAPISGYISKVNAGIGKFAGSNEIIFQITDNSALLLHLEVPLKEIDNLTKGQEVSYWPTLNRNKKFAAVIQSPGRLIDKSTNAISVYATVHSHDTFYPGMQVNAEIKLNSDSVFSVSGEAIFTMAKAQYIFLAYDSQFIKTEIKTGIENSYFTELLNLPDSLRDQFVVTTGKDYLNLELSKINEK